MTGRAMTACGGVTESQERKNDSLSSPLTLGKDCSLIHHLKANKSKFSWLGSFEQRLQFAEEHLSFTRESMRVSENETKKTVKTEQVILNWFFNRKVASSMFTSLLL